VESPHLHDRPLQAVALCCGHQALPLARVATFDCQSRPTGEPHTANLPFSPSAKAVLEHALRESLRMGHDYIGTGHLVLGCVTVRDGRASETLRNLGVSYDGLREAVAELSASATQPT
jgi:ATP-dependent Clp protease ATP-binding subunit ClpA